MQLFDRQVRTWVRPVRHKLNFPHFSYVINNCRKADEIEMGLTGHNKQNLIAMFPHLEDGLTGTENNIPFLVAGTQVVNDKVWYWFIATPLVNEHWFRITREAKKFVQQKKKEHKDKKHLVQVWSGHRSSVGWLNILKFSPIEHYFVGKEKILIVENKN